MDISRDLLPLINQKISKVPLNGFGIDIHQLEHQENSSLKICGINIPSNNMALKGHSDADVALHAIVDAALSISCDGDIGVLFPDTDSTYKDMDSSIFLNKAIDLLKQKDYFIFHVDLTILCQSIKMSPFYKDMIKRLESLIPTATGRINIKSTTAEKLGFIGRSEGITAIANINAIKI